MLIAFINLEWFIWIVQFFFFAKIILEKCLQGIKKMNEWLINTVLVTKNVRIKKIDKTKDYV